MEIAYTSTDSSWLNRFEAETGAGEGLDHRAPRAVGVDEAGPAGKPRTAWMNVVGRGSRAAVVAPERGELVSEPEGLGVEVAVISSDAAVITVCGELDTDTGLALQHQLAGQVVHGRRHLVLDLANVPFMDSSGLRVIVRTVNEMRNIDGSMSLAAPTQVVRRVLDLTGVGMTCRIFDTADAACEALLGGRDEVSHSASCDKS
ncbi:anti-anti-sigma factor [Streptomyces phaeogriseichromatogenes]|nr:anti-anti-sigma factor [Streptomyces murinus]